MPRKNNGIPLYLQDQKQAHEDLLDCYTASQLRGLAIGFIRFSKRYLHFGKAYDSRKKASYYFRLARWILQLDEIRRLRGIPQWVQLDLFELSEAFENGSLKEDHHEWDSEISG